MKKAGKGLASSLSFDEKIEGWNLSIAGLPIWVVVLAILLFWWLALDSMVGDSPTMDEQNHLARGLALWQTGDPRLSLEHPPLVNAISTLPVLLLPKLRLPTDDASWDTPGGWYAFAEKMVWEYNRDIGIARLFFLARLPIVFLTLGLALVGYRFALLMWGRKAALVALLFILFDPNVLAHGRYSTTDLGGTAFLFLATLLLWRSLRYGKTRSIRRPGSRGKQRRHYRLRRIDHPSNRKPSPRCN
jgi:4-amino-4-deoxy-L-arabinose transferase-like glycosyltransferase